MSDDMDGATRAPRTLLQHLPSSRHAEVAELFVRSITSWGPPVADKPSQMVGRVFRFGPADIAEVVNAHPHEAWDAAAFWLRWWESMAPSGSRGRR